MNKINKKIAVPEEKNGIWLVRQICSQRIQTNEIAIIHSQMCSNVVNTVMLARNKTKVILQAA